MKFPINCEFSLCTCQNILTDTNCTKKPILVSFLFPQIEQTNLIALSLKCQVIFIVFFCFFEKPQKAGFSRKNPLIKHRKTAFSGPNTPLWRTSLTKNQELKTFYFYFVSRRVPVAFGYGRPAVCHRHQRPVSGRPVRLLQPH